MGAPIRISKLITAVYKVNRQDTTRQAAVAIDAPFWFGCWFELLVPASDLGLRLVAWFVVGCRVSGRSSALKGHFFDRFFPRRLS